MRPISTASCKEAVPGNIVAASTADGQAAFSPAELVSCLRLGSCDSKLDACDAEGDRPDEEEEDAITYPEGGARAYLAVAGAVSRSHQYTLPEYIDSVPHCCRHWL